MDTDRLRRRVRAHGLALEAGAVLSIASLRLRASPRERLVRALGEPTPASETVDAGEHPAPPGAVRHAQRVGRMVTRVARLLPWHPECLPQAVATQWMLRRRGIPSVLHLGVADVASMDAHAWVTAGQRVVVGRVAQTYAPVASFPSRARAQRSGSVPA